MLSIHQYQITRVKPHEVAAFLLNAFYLLLFCFFTIHNLDPSKSYHGKYICWNVAFFFRLLDSQCLRLLMFRSIWLLTEGIYPNSMELPLLSRYLIDHFLSHISTNISYYTHHKSKSCRFFSSTRYKERGYLPRAMVNYLALAQAIWDNSARNNIQNILSVRSCVECFRLLGATFVRNCFSFSSLACFLLCLSLASPASCPNSAKQIYT